MKLSADPVDRRAVLHIIGNAFDDSAAFKSADYVRIRRQVEALPSAQPETANIIVGKSRNGMTMWYQCDNCNEPVDENDLYCRGCGRRFEHGFDRASGGDR